MSIVEETNRCASVVNPLEEWKTNQNELQAYFGFYILMGMVKEPEIWDYWAKDPTFSYHPISDKISRKRFEEISRYLHFVNTDLLPKRGQRGYHRLQWVKPVIEMLRERFMAVYRPDVNISIDEAMIPFKGKKNALLTFVDLTIFPFFFRTLQHEAVSSQKTGEMWI